jgi:esterase
MPILLVRGADSKLVRDADAERFRRQQPQLRQAAVADAGHAVQSDQPLALAELILDFSFG